MGIALDCDRDISHIFHAKCLMPNLKAQERTQNKRNCPTCQNQIAHVRVLNPDPFKECTARLNREGSIEVTIRYLNDNANLLISFGDHRTMTIDLSTTHPKSWFVRQI